MTLIEQKPTIIAKPGAAYRMRLAQNADDVRKAQRLRFEVFNLELGEGLAASHALERDVDAFDDVCDHLIVEEIATGEVVGTYRLQTGRGQRRGTSVTTASASSISGLRTAPTGR